VTARESYRPRVHIGCIRLPPQMVSSRLTHHETCPYAAGLATGDDWPLLLRFSDKEEVPGSSPGSPTSRSACISVVLGGTALVPHER
jgi:hypothetical protein